MDKKEINLTVDTIQQSYSTIGTFKQLDSVFLNIQITESGVAKDLTELSIKLFARRADKELIEQREGIDILNAQEGKITVDLKNAIFNNIGIVVCELELSRNTKVISTANFTFKVQEKIGITHGIENTIEIDTLKEVEVYVNQAKKEIQNFKILQTEMLQTNSTMNTQENIREEQELKRKESETIREQQEADRAENFNQYDQKLIDLENRMTENIAKQYLEVSTDTGHIKVENCYNGRTKDLSIKGRTLQNLLGNTKFLETEITSTNETSSNKVMFSVSLNNILQLVKPSTQYTFYLNLSVINSSVEHMYIQLNYIDSNNNEDGLFSNILKKTNEYIVIKFTTPDNFKALKLLFIGGKGGSATLKTDGGAIILEGDHTVNPPQHYFEGIKSLGEEEENKISILSTGKNLCDLEVVNGTWNGMVSLTPTEGYNCFKNPIDLKCFPKNITISINGIKVSGNIRFYDKNKKFIEQLYNQNPPIILKENYRYMTWHGADSFPIGGQVQIEEGINVTKYISYQGEDKKDILLPNSMNGAKALLNGVSDIIESGGRIEQKCDKYKLIGEDINHIETVLSNVNLLVFKLSKFKKQNTDSLNSIISDTKIIPISDRNNIGNVDYISILQGADNELVIQLVADKSITTKQQAIEHLKTKNINIIAELNNYIIHKAQTVTDHNLKTFKEITHVSCLNNIIPNNLSAKFPVSLSDTISRLTNENKNLERENNLFKDNQSFMASVMFNMLNVSVLPAENEDRDLWILKKLEGIRKY